MTQRRQQGILLLPVALTLALIGTLAYTMTRDGSMTVSAVDAQYEIERARYLAASGVQLAKWRAAKDKCSSADKGNFDLPDLHGGRVTAANAELKKGVLTVNVTATTDGQGGGAVHKVTKALQLHSLGDPKQKTLIGGGADDITIVRFFSNDAGAKSLVATDGLAHPLVYFKLPDEMNKALIFQANLELTKESSNSTQANRTLGVHRITTAWSETSVTWTHPWANDGGDYVATAAASEVIDPDAPTQFNGAYRFRIHSLVQGWVDGALPNYGMLLKPTRLFNAKFVSFDGSDKPELDVRYYLRCT